jgi:hypothetical protein
MNGSPSVSSLPLNIVGGSTFGRYPKISIEKTYNMIVSDNFLVPYAGYIQRNAFSLGQEGRGIYSSNKYNHIVMVIDNKVYIVDSSLSITQTNTIDTYTGDVYISENNGGQIAICDQKDIYILNYVNNTFQKAVIDFLPGYITFQDTYFISTDQITGSWRLSDNNDGTSWPDDAQHVGEFQTKPDKAVAAVRMPGRGNLLLVFGSTVCEEWYDVGAQLFPYQKNTFSNLDYGCINAATIDSLEDFVVWVSSNEKAGPTITYSDGTSIKQISTDGINFQLADLTNPTNAYGFLFRQDGHLFYQVTWPSDNLTLTYDFNTQKFFHLCDKYMNYHIAKKAVYFRGNYFFVAINNGNFYELNSLYTTYNGDEIPRIRQTAPLRLPSQDLFIVNRITFTIEQGDNDSIQRVDMALSKDGGVSFGNFQKKVLNRIGNRPNRLNWWGCGRANDVTVQFRFWGEGRFVATDGFVSIYK